MESDTYRQLQKHLDRMPVGFPRTRSGIELRILQRHFTPEEVAVALYMDHHFRTAKDIDTRRGNGGSSAHLLESMNRKGSILSKQTGKTIRYALAPYVVGIYEMQLDRLSVDFLRDSRKFFKEGFGLEFLSSDIPQMRVIPIEKSVDVSHHVATYDEIRSIFRASGERLAIVNCICKIAKDMDNDPCKVTDKRETCFVLRDFCDEVVGKGQGRKISMEEAMAILTEAEKDGLVLQPANAQDPQFVCACCSCCCGMLAINKAMKRPADFMAFNYQVVPDSDDCNGCAVCVQRCQMEALSVDEEKRLKVDYARCIGCGLCVTSCKRNALKLEKRRHQTVPPRTDEDLYDHILRHKPGKLKKLVKGIKGLAGIRL